MREAGGPLPPTPQLQLELRVPQPPSRGWTSPFCGPEQLPQPGIPLWGGEMFPGGAHGLRTVSEKTRLQTNQGHSIRALLSSFEMKQAAFLQNAQPQTPFGDPGC